MGPVKAADARTGNRDIIWFRRDLRVHDHPALTAAIGMADEVMPLFVADPVLLRGRHACARRTDWLWAAVDALRSELEARGSGLVVREGDPASVVVDVAREVGATEVHVTVDHTPYARRRDAAVASALRRIGSRLVEHPGLLVHEVGSIRTDAGRPYAIFGPFHRRWQAAPRRPSLPAPERIASPASIIDEAPSRFGGPATREPVSGGLPLAPSGEAGAMRQLEAFLPRLAAYGAERDRLDRDATSHLSAALHLGTVSPIVLVERVAAIGNGGADRFLAEVAWRDFYAHRLAQAVADGAIDRDPVAWRDDPAAFDAWKAGLTGYPVVDAGMRQLVVEGWLPNRARMIVASFLVKDLLVDWRLGADHFLRHLEDGDVASNGGNWRWVAGVGPGSAPWFRVFDPVAQGQRHDPDGRWIRRWLPELADFSDAHVHEPWLAPSPPAGDPARIVDHDAARRRALDASASRRQS